MKKIVASVGLVTLSASALQTAIAQDVTAPDASKPWSVSATLRGFYDDNPGTVPNDISVANRESFGFEISPAAALAGARITWERLSSTDSIVGSKSLLQAFGSGGRSPS